MSPRALPTSATRSPPADPSRVESVRIGALRPHPHNARTHSKKQIQQIAISISRFGFLNPIIVDDQWNIVAGHARFEAAKALGAKVVPVIRIGHLSDVEIRAYVLADNKLAANAGWDREQLAIEFEELQIALPQIGLDLDITGFEAAEVDVLLSDMASAKFDPADEAPPLPDHALTQRGDLWLLGRHRILCGDARDPEAVRLVMNDERAAAVFCDPPYNVPMQSIGGRGRVRHRDFAFASGEMDADQFRGFLKTTLGNAARFSSEGAVHFVCMDWRHVADLIEVGRDVYGEMLNLVVWNKSNAGQGSFYRSKHELICVFRVGNAGHRNNVELGRFGRNRSNVWDYPGVNTFGRNRLEHLSMHPTVKPVGMVADALRDCTARGDSVLDSFGGSGTLVLAAERVGRRGHVIEIDPRFVDVTIARWQSESKLQATLAGDGRSFEEVGRERAGSAEISSPHFSLPDPPSRRDDRPGSRANRRSKTSSGGGRG